jgi:hypothetical protein
MPCTLLASYHLLHLVSLLPLELPACFLAAKELLLWLQIGLCALFESSAEKLVCISMFCLI